MNIDITKAYFLDESSINCGMTRLYGRAFSHERVNDYVPDVRFERTSIISAFGLNGMIAPMCFKGTLDGDFFRGYLEQVLAPEMKADETLFLDNASVHKVTDVLDSLIDKGVNVVFIPEYSPDLSPIELAWSKIKSILRKLKARALDELYNALKIALESLTSDDCLHWFQHCGYSL